MSYLNLYIGVMAQGIKKESLQTFYSYGPITEEGIIRVRDLPSVYQIKPILKPLSLFEKSADFRTVIYTGHLAISDLTKDDIVKHIQFNAAIINQVRKLGYDCDNLLSQGLAIPHKIIRLL